MVENGLYILDYDGDFSEMDLNNFWLAEAENGVHEFIYDKITWAIANEIFEEKIRIFKFRWSSGIAKLRLRQLVDWIPIGIKYFERLDVEQYEKCIELQKIKLLLNQKYTVCQ